VHRGQRAGVSNSSPWGYKPPSMPGLDVVSPFDMAGLRRDGPRPLQPPPTKRPNGTMQTAWSSDFGVGTGDMGRPLASNSYNQNSSPEQMFPSPNSQPLAHQLAQQHQQQSAFGLEPLNNQGDGRSSQNGYVVSPYSQMIPLASPQSQNSLNLGPGSDPFAGTGALEQFFHSNNLGQESAPGSQGNGASQSQFGNAMLDQFDFSNLGLDLENGPVALGGSGGFNPFALPQTEAEG
jgi:hypothetical protein